MLLQVPGLLDTGEEGIQEGSVGFKVYVDYYKAGKGYIFLNLFFLLSLITQVNLPFTVSLFVISISRLSRRGNVVVL